MNKGVRVEIGQGEAAIDLYVVVEYGRNIPELAAQVQQKCETPGGSYDRVAGGGSEYDCGRGPVSF